MSGRVPRKMRMPNKRTDEFARVACPTRKARCTRLAALLALAVSLIPAASIAA
jgi:hypothetical protein